MQRENSGQGHQPASHFIIRDAQLSDIPRISEIYNQSISTAATYDIDPEPVDTRYQWFLSLEKAAMPVLVAVNQDEYVLGWAALSPFNPRPGFRFTLENSLYVCHSSLGQGIGKALLQSLLSRAVKLNCHCLIAKIDSSNIPSIRLHEQSGFVHAGILKQAGFKFDRFLDVTIMQFFCNDLSN